MSSLVIYPALFAADSYLAPFEVLLQGLAPEVQHHPPPVKYVHSWLLLQTLKIPTNPRYLFSGVRIHRSWNHKIGKNGVPSRGDIYRECH